MLFLVANKCSKAMGGERQGPLCPKTCSLVGSVCSSVHAEGYRRVSHKNSAHLTPCHIDFHDGQIVSARSLQMSPMPSDLDMFIATGQSRVNLE